MKVARSSKRLLLLLRRRLEAAKTCFVQGQIGTWWSSHVEAEADRQLGGVVGGGGVSDDAAKEVEEVVASVKEGICYVIFWITRRKLPA